jgi:rare lipoprotein A (peptidoglycan hydrolase)
MPHEFLSHLKGHFLYAAVLLILFTGCQTNPRSISPYRGTQTKPSGRSQLIPQTHQERIAKQPKRVGFASFYGEELRGSPMANGVPFNPDELTAASWFFPFGTQIQVLHENRSVIVTITDRGPAMRLVRQGRIIDLSEAAFRQLADPRNGLIYVRLYRLPTDS